MEHNDFKFEPYQEPSDNYYYDQPNLYAPQFEGIQLIPIQQNQNFDHFNQFSQVNYVQPVLPRFIDLNLETRAPELIERINEYIASMESVVVYVKFLPKYVSDIKDMLINFFSDPDEQLQYNIITSLEQIKTQVERYTFHIYEILTGIVLGYRQLQIAYEIIADLQYNLRKVTIYQNELTQYLSGNFHAASLGELFILRQPPPQIVFKGKTILDEISICLINSAYNVIEPRGKITCQIIGEGNQKFSKIENHEIKIDNFTQKGTLNNFRLQDSSKMNIVKFQFFLKAIIGSDEVLLESLPSNSAIVITSETQWIKAIKKIIVEELFTEGKMDISYIYFVNYIQYTWILNSRPKLESPDYRELQYYEFDYIQSKISLGTTLSKFEACSFLDWFLPMPATLRFKKHVHSLWIAGFIYPFIPKAICEEALLFFGAGTFLLRFSESNPGTLDIAYVSKEENTVKHFLVKNSDIAVNKSVADFLKNKSQFKEVLRIDCTTGRSTIMTKDQAFAPYYTKSQKIVSSTNPGYTDELSE